jgi:hypothetical protein
LSESRLDLSRDHMGVDGGPLPLDAVEPDDVQPIRRFRL